MIISPTHGFVFVHIPKCAGTTVRTQIARCDANHLALAETGSHPVLGDIDYGHVQLPLLRQHFPEHYAHLETLTAFAIVRDPLSRFGSALRQVLWQYEQTPMTLIKPEVLRDRALATIDTIGTEIDAPAFRNIFFARQADYLFDGDRQLVDHPVPIELVGDFISYLSAKTNTPMISDTKSNQNVDLKHKWLGPVAFKVNGFLRERLPQGLHTRLKDVGVGLLASKKSAAEASGILDLPEVRQFVAETYAKDAEIYAKAQADKDALQAGFQSGDLPRLRSVR